ncbi:MAG: GNAT family N-acetyltransferase [Clostridia bacterium]|nr:GNAT family N-acetyltransferase [Clostridia bacterium]
MIRFEEITNKNIWKVCMLEPFEEQKDFVAENIQSLAEAYATRNEGNNALPLAVYNDVDLIGFVMIGKGTVGNEDESDLIKDNYSLWRLMIDIKYQAQGLGKQTIDAVMALIRTFPFGEAKKVWLSYEPENIRARAIYRKYGFVENGNVRQRDRCGIRSVANHSYLSLGIHIRRFWLDTGNYPFRLHDFSF